MTAEEHEYDGEHESNCGGVSSLSAAHSVVGSCQSETRIHLLMAIVIGIWDNHSQGVQKLDPA